MFDELIDGTAEIIDYKQINKSEGKVNKEK